MRSVEYSSYDGGASSLKHCEGPIPVPKADEVVMKVEAVSLNTLDLNILKGRFRPFLPSKFPYTPGTDVAGEIVEVGSGVSKFKAGDKVVAWLQLGGGGLADYAVARERMTVIRPAEVSAVQAAGLPVPAITAYQALTQDCNLKLDGTDDKKNILITAASGGVGHYAVQLAKLGNAHVTATCGARNLELVKSLGADEVLDYKTPEGAALESPSGKKYDYVIHGARDTPWSTFKPNLATNGLVIDLTPTSASLLTSVVKKVTFSKKKMTIFLLNVKVEYLEYLVNLLKENKLKTVVDSTHPLSKVEDAWEVLNGGHATGRIIVEP